MFLVKRDRLLLPELIPLLMCVLTMFLFLGSVRIDNLPSSTCEKKKKNMRLLIAPLPFFFFFSGFDGVHPF